MGGYTSKSSMLYSYLNQNLQDRDITLSLLTFQKALQVYQAKSELLSISDIHICMYILAYTYIKIYQHGSELQGQPYITNE